MKTAGSPAVNARAQTQTAEAGFLATLSGLANIFAFKFFFASNLCLLSALLRACMSTALISAQALPELVE